MKHEIWRFQLKDRQTEILMPDPVSLISVQLQDGVVCLWVIVNPESPKVKKKFQAIATGEPFDITGKIHIGTFQQRGLVWHIFSVKNF